MKALVERYIADGQPVGSRTLSRASGLELSPATIRNVMSDLEELGLIASPHTSAGRIPTARGYRLFVDTMLTAQRDQLRAPSLAPDQPQKVIANAAQMLSNLSQFVGVVMAPRRTSVFHHIEFLRLSERRVLVIIVSPEGDVQNRVIFTETDYTQPQLLEAANFLNANYTGLAIEQVRFGERLEDIARVRGVAVSRLRSINGVDDSAEVRAGLTLLLPPSRSAQEPLVPGSLAGDEIVVVAVPDKSFAVPGKKQIFYRTISGDSIWSIARFFKVKDTDLLRWNSLDPEATLATKMVLSLWVDPKLDTSQVVLVDPARVRVVTTGSDEFFELVETLRGRKQIGRAHV